MKISKINVRLNGEKLDGAEIEQTADNAFVINTGADLTIEDKLEVFYTVVFTDPSLHDQDIVNVATAKGENTEEERQDNCVHIVDETPGLQIKKSSDKTSYKVGETGHCCNCNRCTAGSNDPQCSPGSCNQVCTG